jgi:regulator of protease activity HflC (stomatin/prohibitin superfamily)
LNKIFDWLLQFVPQFDIVLPNEEAVRITCIPFIHKWHKVCPHGWYAYWPLFQNFEKKVVRSQMVIVELSREVNGKALEALWVVQYRVNDIYNALYRVEDLDEILVGQAAKAIGISIMSRQEIDLKKVIQSGMWGCGIEIQEVFPVQMVPARAHKVFFDNLAEKVGRIL